MAVCYSCALLPEPSCEEFNSFLDRALLIKKEKIETMKIAKSWSFPFPGLRINIHK